MSELTKFVLLAHCIRGVPGDVVEVWPQDVALLQANGLIGEEPASDELKQKKPTAAEAEAAKAAAEAEAKAKAEADAAEALRLANAGQNV